MSKPTFEPLIVGKLASVFGIKGWLKVVSYTEPFENILQYKPWLILQRGEWREFTPLQGKQHSKGLIVHLAGYDNPETARSLTGCEIAIRRDQLPALPEGEYYWADLVGLNVINQDKIMLGKVIELLATGANDVLIVQGEKRHLVPFLKGKTVLSIDLNDKLIQVDWDADF